MITSVKTVIRSVAAVSSIALIGAFAFVGTPTFASSDYPDLAFSPRCVSNDAGVALFEVESKEESTVTLHFSDVKGSGSQDLTKGINRVYVPYADGMDLNVAFSYGANSQHKTEVQMHDICTADQLPAPDPTCVDGTDASNLDVKWNNDSMITISTKSKLPICEDVTVYYSTYRMPDNYDGTGFGINNPTSYPQTGLESYELTLEANTFGTWLRNVPMPDYCANIQADLYYGPQVTNIGGDALGYHGDGTPVQTSADAPNGHGIQNIASVIFTRDTTKCGTPGMGGGNGGSTTTPTTPTMPTGGNGAGTTITMSAPTVLPNTGVEDTTSNLLSSLISLLFGASAAGLVGVRSLRR